LEAAAAACEPADGGFSAGCGDSELLAERGDGSDILGRMVEDDSEPGAAAEADDVFFPGPGAAGGVPSLDSADVWVNEPEIGASYSVLPFKIG